MGDIFIFCLFFYFLAFFIFHPILFLSPKCLISIFNSNGHWSLLLRRWVSSLSCRCASSPPSASEVSSVAATIASAPSHATRHSPHHHHHHGHGIISSTHPAKSHAPASAGNALSFNVDCQLSPLEQWIVQMLCAHCTLHVCKLDISVTKKWFTNCEIILPEWFFCMRVFFNSNTVYVAAVFKMLLQLCFVCLEVYIFNPDWTFIRIVLNCNLATLVGIISAFIC